MSDKDYKDGLLDFDAIDFFDEEEEEEIKRARKQTAAEEQENEKIIPVPADEAEEDYGDDYGDDYGEDYEEESFFSFVTPKRIIIALIVLFSAALIVMLATVNTGFIGRYKENFKNNVSAILRHLPVNTASNTDAAPTPAPTYKTITKATAMLPLENAAEAQFVLLEKGVAAAQPNRLTYIDNNCEAVWSVNTIISSPVAASGGDYIALAERGGTKLCLYQHQKLVYSASTDGAIELVSVSSNGDIAVVTEKDGYKGAVSVYNKAGERVFAWNSGSGSILSADISARSRRVAIATIDTTSTVSSTVMLFELSQTQSTAQRKFENSAVFRLEFIGESLNVFADNFTGVMDTKARVKWKCEFSDGELSKAETDPDGIWLLLADEDNVPIFYCYTQDGRKRASFKATELPDNIDIYSGTVAYNSGRNVIVGETDGSGLRSYTASMDVNKICLVNEATCLLVYNNSLEMIYK